MTIEERLVKLERANRRLTAGIVLLLLAAGAVGIFAATAPVGPIRATDITARSITLVNPGTLGLLEISPGEGGYRIYQYGPSGQRFDLSLSGLRVSADSGYSDFSALGVESGPVNGHLPMALFGSYGITAVSKNGLISLATLRDGPLLDIAKGGFSTQIGVTKMIGTADGEDVTTSAASIVMFGNDRQHLAIWRAPAR